MSKKQLFLRLCGPSARRWRPGRPVRLVRRSRRRAFFMTGAALTGGAGLFRSGAASCGLRRASASLGKLSERSEVRSWGSAASGAAGEGAQRPSGVRAAPPPVRAALDRLGVC